MKKIVLTMVAVICLATTSFAAGNQPTANNWTANINVEMLAKYLKLSEQQAQEVEHISDFFTEEMETANNADSARTDLTTKAVKTNLRLMSKTLDKKQYAKYALLVKTTLYNKGIKINK